MDDEKKNPAGGLTRRDLLVKGAAAVGAVAVGMYVPPKITPIALPKAHAKSAPANKENCEKDPTSDKDPNEDCDKCVMDKDPSEKDKDYEGSKKEENDNYKSDPNYDKCVTDKPCDKPPGEKDPHEGSGLQIEPKRFPGKTEDEWG